MAQILDLDDWILSLYSEGEMRYSEPAAALDTRGSITFGRAAMAESRIHPRRVNLSYLSRLNAEPLPQPFQNARNHADLLYHHLLAVVEAHPSLTRDPVLVTVRSATTPEQLGLVLGIAEQCGIRVGAFVDRSVATIASYGARLVRSAEHVALEFGAVQGELCHATVTNDASRSRLREFPGQGLSQIQDGWVNIIADHFIRFSRFDPLHAATTEQQLYDTVYAWFGTGEPQGAITVEHQRETRRVEVQADELRRKLQERIGPMLTELAGSAAIYLGPNASSTPLLTALLRQSGFLVHVQSRARVLQYVEQHVSALINAEEVRFLRTLPLVPGQTFFANPPTAEPATAQTSRPTARTLAKSIPGRPTHGLHSTIAYPIGGSELPVDLVGPEPRSGVTLDINGRLFTLIEVRS